MLIQVWAYEWSWQSLYTKNTYLLKEKPLTWLDFFLVWFMKNESESHSAVSKSLQPHGLYSPWNSLGHNTGVGSLSLLQGIFPTQELNWDLLHYRRILYQLSYQGSPRERLFWRFPRKHLDSHPGDPQDFSTWSPNRGLAGLRLPFVSIAWAQTQWNGLAHGKACWGWRESRPACLCPAFPALRKHLRVLTIPSQQYSNANHQQKFISSEDPF